MRAALAIVLALAACGDNAPGFEPPQSLADLPAAIARLPGVTIVGPLPTRLTDAGYQYYTLEFTQPVDHADPDGQTFQQEVSLIVRDVGATPLVVHTTGYDDYWLDYPVELTEMFAANQITIEHRYFGSSRPVPTDWSKLRIEQMAADEHHVIELLHQVFPGAPFLASGESKGGMTAVFHRRFYPDDVAATIPYVAPLSFGAPDDRYTDFFTNIGGDANAACRQGVRAAATEMLQHRRAALVQAATSDAIAHDFAYTRIALGPAVESAVLSLEWAFWQYHGVAACKDVPPVTADDATLYDFLEAVSPVEDSDDASIAEFEPYYYQADEQLGFPAGGAAYLTPYLQYGDDAYAGLLSVPAPAYDHGGAMTDIDEFVRTRGDQLLFVYGQWDPWSAGMYTVGDGRDAARYIEPDGTHGSTITFLADADRAAALAHLQQWTGLTPTALPQKRRARKLRQVPPALLHVLARQKID